MDSWFVSYYAHVPTTNAKLLTPSARGATKFGRDRNGLQQVKVCYYSILHTVGKVVIIVGLSVITFMCLQQMQNCWHPQLWEQRNLNEIGMVATRKSLLLLQTPYCRESSNDSWFVSYYIHVPTTNAKLLTPSAMGATKFEFDRNGCNK